MSNNLPLRPPTRPNEPLPYVTAPSQHPLRPAADPDVQPFDDRIEPIIDVVRIRQLVLFPIAAARRRRQLAVRVFSVVALATIATAALLPRTYFVESRILARRNMVMPALGNPRRTVPTASDAPMRLAAEAVLSRESLISIVDSTKLLSVWSSVLSPLGLMRRQVSQVFTGPPTRNEQVDVMVGMLERRMWVSANDADEGIVSIGVVWRDPESAFRIVQAGQRNFLDRRFASEVTLIKESIDILERYVATAHEAIEESMTDLRKIPGVKRNDSGIESLLASGRASARSRAAVERVAQLRAQLSQKRAQVADLENSRNQRLATLQTQLAELQSRYGAAHPEVASAKSSINLLKGEFPELTALRAEERDLTAKLITAGSSSAAVADPGIDPAMQRLAWERLARGSTDSLEDPQLTYGRSRLKIATTNYEEMLDRLEGARIELETARAAFKYRYTVIAPPQFPKKAMAPNVPLLLVGGLVLAVLLSLFAATAVDLASGRFVEAWQVERQLGLRVLGEVRGA